MPEQGGLAGTGWTQYNDGGIRYLVEYLVQALELFAGLPARPLCLLALIQQQGQLDKAFVQRIAFIRPAVAAGLIIAPVERPVGFGGKLRRA